MTTGFGLKHYEEMFSIQNLIRQRRWATMFVGVVLLAGCSLSPSCFTLFAKDDSTYETLEKRVRAGKEFKVSGYDTLSESDQFRLKQLNRELNWLGPTFWPIPYETVSGAFGLSVFFRFS